MVRIWRNVQVVGIVLRSQVLHCFSALANRLQNHHPGNQPIDRVQNIGQVPGAMLYHQAEGDIAQGRFLRVLQRRILFSNPRNSLTKLILANWSWNSSLLLIA